MARKKKGSGSPDAGTPDAGAAAMGPTNEAIAEAKKRGKDKPKPTKKQGNRKGTPSKAARKAEIERAEKIKEALDYRRQGYTYSEIADAMECSAGTAWNWVREGIAAIPEEAADQLRRMELDRLDMMQSRLFDQFMEAPQTALVDTILKIMGTRARYLKLYVEDDGAGNFLDNIAQRMKDAIVADKPVLRPDGPLPAHPVL